MKIDRRITNGLAWAGAVLVVGVPLADIVSGQMMGDRADARPAQVAKMEPIAAVAPVPVALSQRPAAPQPKPAATAVAAQPAAPSKPAPSVAPVTAAPAVAATTPPRATAAAPQGDVVDNYLKAGKPLPSYITNGGADAVAVAQPPVAPVQATVIDPVTVAALTPAETAPASIAPMPMPLSMRPQPVLIVEDTARTRSIDVVPDVNPRSSAAVTYNDLQDWESGPLSEFLASRQGSGQVAADYDADGFYLDEGPNGAPRRGRLIGPADPWFIPFGD